MNFDKSTNIINEAIKHKFNMETHQANIATAIKAIGKFADAFHLENSEIGGYELLEALQIYSLLQFKGTYKGHDEAKDLDDKSALLTNEIREFISKSTFGKLTTEFDPRIIAMSFVQSAAAVMHAFVMTFDVLSAEEKTELLEQIMPEIKNQTVGEAIEFDTNTPIDLSNFGGTRKNPFDFES